MQSSPFFVRAIKKKIERDKINNRVEVERAVRAPVAVSAARRKSLWKYFVVSVGWSYLSGVGLWLWRLEE